MLYAISEIIKTKNSKDGKFPYLVFDETFGKWRCVNVTQESESNLELIVPGKDDCLPVITYPSGRNASFYKLKRQRNLYIAKIIDGYDFVYELRFDFRIFRNRTIEVFKKISNKNSCIIYYIIEPLEKVNQKDFRILISRMENYLVDSEEKKIAVKNAFASIKKGILSRERNVFFKNGLFPIEINKLLLVQSEIINNFLENDEDDVYLLNITNQDFDNFINAILEQNIEKMYNFFEILDYLDSYFMSLVIDFVKKKYYSEKSVT